jgi:hypothetical protein
MISAQSQLSLYTEHFDKLLSIYNQLLDEARQNSDKEGAFFCHCSMANLYFCLLDKAHTEKYLNDAAVIIDQVKNGSNLAFYHNIKAQYIQHYFPDRIPEAVHNYQVAISHYDKTGSKGREEEMAIMLRNLSIDAFFRNDSTYINKVIRRLKDFKVVLSSPIVHFIYMHVTSLLHTMYYQDSFDERFLDSTNYYLQQCLDIHEQGLLPKSFDYVSIEMYAIFAETVSMKRESDIAVIDSLLSIAIEHKVDSTGMARVYQARARTFFYRNMIDSAEAMVLKSQSFLQSGNQKNDYTIEKRNFDFLRAIYEMKGDYKQAIAYNELWAKKTDEIRANEVKELELRFEAEIKETELKQLVAEELHQKNRYKLFVLACALLCLTTLFLVLLLWFKKRNLNSQIKLINAEKEEMNLQVKLKEEQTVKMQLERYIALSDFRLKELEIIGKTKDLEQLYKNKEELDKQVELFRQKVEALEATIQQDNPESNDLQDVITEDLRRIFARQTPFIPYIEKLETLNKAYIDTIIEMSRENLSLSYLKYCVCFAIGMGISEVADCFNIEQTSVHMIRYRLKKKFALANDDDLSDFLCQVKIRNS